MTAPALKRLWPFFGAGLFVVAAVVLWRELHHLHLQDILGRIQHMQTGQILAAAGLTLASYLVMTGYDALALRYIGQRLSYAKTAAASMIGYAFSNNIGFAMIAGASVRYRIYSAWNISAVDITKVVVFCTASIWLGFLSLSGAVFSLAPPPATAATALPVSWIRPVGIVMMLTAAGYLALTVFARKPVAIRGWRFSLPPFRLAVGQIAIASVDWLLAGSVLYVLMPRGTGLSFGQFIGIFLMAQVGGLISQVPGGLGVFESLMVLMATPIVNAGDLLGALVVYRGIYYLSPLLCATLAMGILELLRERGRLKRLQEIAAGALPGLLIPVVSLMVFVAGAVLLFSGALPALPPRLAWLKTVLPLPLLEISHFLGSLAGMGLLLLARGLHRRLDAAYLLTLVLLGAGILASLFKGFDYEEASILALVFVLMMPNRRYFYRRASIFSERFTVGWTAAVAVVLGTSIWLGLFAFRHVDYSSQLWWQFSFHADAPRSMRAVIGALGLALAFAAARLLRPAPPGLASDEAEPPPEVVAVVQASPSAEANLALLGDKRFMLNESKTAFIMYGVSGQSWVAMGDPVGPAEQWAELLWRFRHEADRYGDRAVFYEVGHERLHLYLDMGLTLFKLGEEACVPLSGFSLEGSAKKDLRYIHRKLARQGCVFEWVPKAGVSAYVDTLKEVSDAWLKAKNTREKGFSLGCFDPAYLTRFPVALVRQAGRIVAFANIWISGGKEELTVDLMRYHSDAPAGVMDFLFVELMRRAAAKGYGRFNLGMAPLTGLETGPLAPLWHRFGTLVARFGEHFYNFEGLRQYKEKFDPVWAPRYLAQPGGWTLPRTLADIGALISGGLRGIVLK